MTAKKTMTKAEAFEFLKDKCFLTTPDSRPSAVLKMEGLGLKLWGAERDEFPYIMMDVHGHNFLFLDTPFRTDVLPLSDLLAIEIVEEPAFQWTNGDIDAAYIMGVLNTSAIEPEDNDLFPSLSHFKKETERLNALGFDRPYQAVMSARYPDGKPQVDPSELLKEAVKLLEQSHARIWYWQAIATKKNDDELLPKINDFLTKHSGRV